LGVTHVPLAMTTPNLGDDIQTEAAPRWFGVSQALPPDQPESRPADAQSHSGVAGASTPKVSYIYANGTANQTRGLTTTYPSDKIITMSYGTANSADDRLSRLEGVSLTGDPDPLGEFAWMGSGRLVSLTMPQPGIALSYKHVTGEPVGDAGDPYSGYDRFGRTVDMRWIKTSDSSSLSRIQYGYDKMSRRLWRQDLAAPADTQQDRFYSYDGLGQVTDSAQGNLNINRTSIAGIPAQKEAFDYDAIGNWKQYLRQADGATTLDQKRTSNRDNQLTELDANSDGLAYDAAGNMTACRPDKDGDWSKGYTIVWDAWNRIIQVKNAQTSATVATYAYDGLTRRTTTTIGSTVRHFYYNNLWKCVEERVGSSTNPDRVYYWSTRPGHRDELLRRDRATSGGALNETLWCLMDYFDPIAIADLSGVIQERYTYTAFGLASILTPAFAPRPNSNFAWSFLFHGQFRDSETGWDNYGYRYYLPWLGRWPSRDPIAESGGENIYAAVSNQQPNDLDFLGLAQIITDQTNGKTYWIPDDCCCEQPKDYSSSSAVVPRAKPGAGGPYESDDCRTGHTASTSSNPKAYGPHKPILTNDSRGRWLHGGGSSLGDQGSQEPNQELTPALGCTRMHNADILELGTTLTNYKNENPGKKVPYKRGPQPQGGEPPEVTKCNQEFNSAECESIRNCGGCSK
jgi:RHS repeat-associated protein